MLLFSACTQNAVDIEESEKEIEILQKENSNLKAKNDELASQLSKLEKKVLEEEKQKVVQEGDVTVELSGKSTLTGDYSQDYVTTVFSITNNTDKSIKGVQGVAMFKDLFGVDIISIIADFTGITIEPGETKIVDDLYFDCNQFIDKQMQFYNTAYDDLNFEYAVKSIVFTDGTSKQGN